MLRRIIFLGLTIYSAGIYCQQLLHVKNNASLVQKNGCTMKIEGGATLDNGSTLINNGVINIVAKNNNATADFIDSSTIPHNYGTGKIVFSGNANSQNIYTLNTSERIDIDNSAGVTLLNTLNTKKLYLKNGVITTDTNKVIIISTDSSAIEEDISNLNFTSSWVNGKIRRYVNPATVNNYKFPVGSALNSQLAELDNLTTNPLVGVTYVDAYFDQKPGNDDGLNVTENNVAYTSVNSGGVWYLTPDAEPSGGSYNLKLYFNNFNNLIDNSFGILRRDDTSTRAIDWQIPTGGRLCAMNTPGRTVADGYAQRNGIQTFSQYGIGSTNSPMPLTLVTFNVQKEGSGKSILKWTTANEINNNYFEILKGSTPASIKYLDKVKSSAINGVGSYTYADLSPYKGSNYYQLRIVDKDGNYMKSKLLYIDFNNSFDMSVYPNPVMNNQLSIYANNVNVNSVNLVDIGGKKISCKFISVAGETKVLLPKSITKGTYTLEVTTDKGRNTTSVLVE